MNSPDELKAAYESLREEIYNELRFTLQFSLSHHFLQGTSIDDLPPQFEQLRKQMIEAFWSMIFLRMMLFFEKEGACSLARFIGYAYDLKIIDEKQRDVLIKKFDALRASDEIIKAETIRSKIIAHSDKKKPEDVKIVVGPLIRSIEEIFVSAGGKELDIQDLEEKLGETWSLLFDLIRKDMECFPKDWQSLMPPPK